MYDHFGWNLDSSMSIVFGFPFVSACSLSPLLVSFGEVQLVSEALIFVPGNRYYCQSLCLTEAPALHGDSCTICPY